MVFIDKSKLAEGFGRAATCGSYDANAGLHDSLAAELVASVALQGRFPAVESVLDIGSGSGVVLEHLHRLNPNLQFTANDISPSMLQACSSKFAALGVEIEPLNADAECYPFERHYDLVISSLCYQWFNNFESTVKRLSALSDVLFAFNTLLEGTFSLWQQAHKVLSLPKPLVGYYPSSTQVLSLLNALEGYNLVEAHSSSHRMRFRDGRHFFAYLKNIGASTAIDEYRAGTLRSLISCLGVDFELNYEVLRCVLIKQQGDC